MVNPVEIPSIFALFLRYVWTAVDYLSESKGIIPRVRRTWREYINSSCQIVFELGSVTGVLCVKFLNDLIFELNFQFFVRFGFTMRFGRISQIATVLIMLRYIPKIMPMVGGLCVMFCCGSGLVDLAICFRVTSLAVCIFYGMYCIQHVDSGNSCS